MAHTAHTVHTAHSAHAAHTARSEPVGQSEHPAVKFAPRWALGLVAGIVLALVGAWYLNPHVMLDLADRLWACF